MKAKKEFQNFFLNSKIGIGKKFLIKAEKKQIKQFYAEIRKQDIHSIH